MRTWGMLLALAVALGAAGAGGPARADDKKDDKKDDSPILQLLKKAGVGDKPFTLVVFVTVKPDGVKKFEEQAAKTAKASAAEKGCLQYEVHKSLEKPGGYIFFERWKNLAAIEDHFKEEHTKAVLTLLSEVGDATPEIKVYAPLDGK